MLVLLLAQPINERAAGQLLGRLRVGWSKSELAKISELKNTVRNWWCFLDLILMKLGETGYFNITKFHPNQMFKKLILNWHLDDLAPNSIFSAAIMQTSSDTSSEISNDLIEIS